MANFTSILFGFGSLNIEEVRNRVANALSLDFENRDSFHLGSYYKAQSPSGKFTIRENLDPLDDEPAEQEFPNHAVIVYAEKLSNPDEIRQLLENSAGATYLRWSSAELGHRRILYSRQEN